MRPLLPAGRLSADGRGDPEQNARLGFEGDADKLGTDVIVTSVALPCDGMGVNRPRTPAPIATPANVTTSNEPMARSAFRSTWR